MPFNPSDTLSQLGFGIPMLNELDQPTPPGYVTPGTMQGGGIQQGQQGFPISPGPSEANLAEILGLARPAPNQVLQAPVMGSKRMATSGGPPEMSGLPFAASSIEGTGFPPDMPVWQRIALSFAHPSVQKTVLKNMEMQRATDAAREANNARAEVSRYLRIGDTDKAEEALKTLGGKAKYMKEYMAVSKELYGDINARRLANARADSLFYRAEQLVVDRVDPDGKIIYKDQADPRAVALHRGMAEQKARQKRGEPSDYGLAFIDISGEQMAALENTLGARQVVTSPEPVRIVDTGPGTIVHPPGAYPQPPLDTKPTPSTQPPTSAQPLPPGFTSPEPVDVTKIPDPNLKPGVSGTPKPPDAAAPQVLPEKPGEFPTQPPTQPPPPIAQKPRERAPTAPQYETTPADVGLAEPERFIYGRLPKTRDGRQPDAAIITNMINDKSNDPSIRAEGQNLRNILQNERADFQSMVELFHTQDMARTFNAVGVKSARQLFEMTPTERIDAIHRADEYFAKNNAMRESLKAHELFVGQVQRDMDRAINPLRDIHTVLTTADSRNLPEVIKNRILGSGFTLRIPGVPFPVTLGVPAPLDVLTEGIFQTKSDQQRWLQIERERVRQALSTLSPHADRDSAVIKALLDDARWATPPQARQTTAQLLNVLEDERYQIGKEEFGRRREPRPVTVPPGETQPTVSPETMKNMGEAVKETGRRLQETFSPQPSPTPSPSTQPQPGQSPPAPPSPSIVEEFWRKHPHLITPHMRTPPFPPQPSNPTIQQSPPTQPSYKSGPGIIQQYQRKQQGLIQQRDKAETKRKVDELRKKYGTQQQSPMIP